MKGEVAGLLCSGTTFVMLNPILNIPELIGHQKHPFTKTEGSGIGVGMRGRTKQNKALPNGQHWMDKTKA